MKVLVSNVGSTSLKFKIYKMPEETVLCESKVERVGSEQAIYHYKNLQTGEKLFVPSCSVKDYSAGIQMFLRDCLSEKNGVLKDVSEVAAVGFKTVVAKGFYGVHELTEEVLQAMREYLLVAPAHNGPYLEAIQWFRELIPSAKMVGVFETAFHETVPQERQLYPIPYEWYETYGIKRMGYHGASHGYVAKTMEEMFGKEQRTISCHLGGSCSICAIVDGKSTDISFGFSPQSGVMHANRAGDMDPYIIPFLLDCGMPLEEIMSGLAKNGGLKGISGVSNDLREIEESRKKGNARAGLAVRAFVHSIVHYIGAYYAEMGGLDNLVFTGGIGENSVEVRKEVCDTLLHMGIEIDASQNECYNKANRIISMPGSKVRVLVIPANEEIGIARNTYQFINKCKD